jgi:hypothetical protein
MWLRSRSPRRTVRDKEPSKVPTNALLLLFVILVALSAYLAIEHPSFFHLTVIAASVALFALIYVGRVQSSRKIVGVFFIAALAVNIMMTYVANELGGGNSGRIALVSVILFTWLIGLLLFSRARTRPSILAKAVLMGAIAAVFIVGSISHLSAPEEGYEGILGYVFGWCIAAMIPLAFLFVMTVIVMTAYHRSEVTLPSDKWI